MNAVWNNSVRTLPLRSRVQGKRRCDGVVQLAIFLLLFVLGAVWSERSGAGVFLVETQVRSEDGEGWRSLESGSLSLLPPDKYLFFYVSTLLCGRRRWSGVWRCVFTEVWSAVGCGFAVVWSALMAVYTRNCDSRSGTSGWCRTQMPYYIPGNLPWFPLFLSSCVDLRAFRYPYAFISRCTTPSKASTTPALVSVSPQLSSSYLYTALSVLSLPLPVSRTLSHVSRLNLSDCFLPQFLLLQEITGLRLSQCARAIR